MLTRLKDYCFALIVLSLCLVIYQATVARWLQPAEVAFAATPRRELSSRDDSLNDLFAQDAWQRGRCMRLKTDGGMLLFQNWKQIDGKSWKLWPITIVIGRGLSKEASQQPVLIEASEGAMIQFAQPLESLTGVAPEIHRGQMLGDVQITRHPPPIPATDATSVYQTRVRSPRRGGQSFFLRTSHVGIDNRRLWTTEPIHMKVGDATLIGRDLTLYLTASASSGKSDITGALDRMELIYLKELILPLGRSAISTNTPNPDTPETVQIHCGGRIEYDFALDQLRLDEDVRLQHVFENAPLEQLDRFECQSLKLTLRDPMNASLHRTSAIDWIDRVEADGSPVRLVMPTRGLDISAGQLMFDALSGELIAKSMPSLATQGVTGNRMEPVIIHRGNLTALLSDLAYQFDPKIPEQLGTIQVRGGGEVTQIDAGSALKRFAWQESLRIEPLTPATRESTQTQFGVWCDGGLRAELADGGIFISDHVQGVLRSGVDRQLLPERVTATGGVRLQTPTLHAATEQLQLFFESNNTVAAPRTGTQAAGLRNWVSQPGGETDDVSTTENTPPAVATLRGNRVNAKLTMFGRELTASDLSVEGNVEVTHPFRVGNRSSQPDAAYENANHLLAVLTGDQLRIRDGGGADVIQLTSDSQSPARLQLGDGYFIGPAIQIRPDDNYVMMNDAGEFKIPSEMLPPTESIMARSQQPPNTRFGAPMHSTTRWAQSPRVRFGGGMTFNGQTAILSGGVALDAEIIQDENATLVQMSGDEMQVQLDRSVDMQSNTTVGQMELNSISLLQLANQPVQVTVQRLNNEGVLQSLHQLQTHQLQWSPQPSADASGGMAGIVSAPGSGSYRGWIRGAPDGMLGFRLPASDSANAGSNQESFQDAGLIETPSQSESLRSTQETITGIHLVFQDGMLGDLLAKSLTFQGGVRIAKQAVPELGSEFDASQMNFLSQDEMTLDCDRIRLAIDPAAARIVVGLPPSTWEMEAAGGVLYRTRNENGLLEVTADRCVYSAAKDLFTVEGGANRPARLKQTNATGQPGNDLVLRNLTVRLKTMEVVSSQIESFQLGKLPNAGPR